MEWDLKPLYFIEQLNLDSANETWCRFNPYNFFEAKDLDISSSFNTWNDAQESINKLNQKHPEGLFISCRGNTRFKFRVIQTSNFAESFRETLLLILGYGFLWGFIGLLIWGSWSVYNSYYLKPTQIKSQQEALVWKEYVVQNNCRVIEIKGMDTCWICNDKIKRWGHTK